MSYFRSADPDVDFTRHDREQAERMKSLRQCCDCRKAIQDEHYFDIYGDIYCEKCVNDRFRRVND